MIIRVFFRITILISVLLLAACAGSSAGDLNKSTAANPDDPHESFNRGTDGFNKGVDTYVSSPLVGIYHLVSPAFLRTAITNFFTNLKEPRTVINDALQGKAKPAGDDLERFVINSLFGLGGLIDVASYAEIEYHEEDFSQTLAVWGVPRGEYLVIPLLGPSSYRGIPGIIVDAASSPVSYVIWPIQVLDLLNTRSNAEQSLRFLDEAALDPYIFMRESYLQWREHQISEGNNLPTNLQFPEMEDSFDDEVDFNLLNDDLDIKL